MLDSLYRRRRGRRLAPLLSRLTGGKVAAERTPEERWFRDHWQAADQVLAGLDAFPLSSLGVTGAKLLAVPG